MPWPKHVIFLEPPVICRWDPQKKNWTKSDIHNVQYEEGTVRFRTGIFGIFAFASPRHKHLPFRNWRITPEKDDSITVKILSTVLKMDFNIKGDSICLAAVENGSAQALDDILGKYLKLNRLKRHLREAGVDIFPGTLTDKAIFKTNYKQCFFLHLTEYL